MHEKAHSVVVVTFKVLIALILAGSRSAPSLRKKQKACTGKQSYARLPMAAGLFHFPLFLPHNIQHLNSFISSLRQDALSTCNEVSSQYLLLVCMYGL